MNRREFVSAVGATLVSSPSIFLRSALAAPANAFRIVVVANTYYEGDGLMAALAGRMARNPNLDVPREVAWPRQAPEDRPGKKNVPVDPRPRCIIGARPLDGDATGRVEIWCLDDLMQASISHGASDNKAQAMRIIADYTPPNGVAGLPDGVIAFGTAGDPGEIPYDGCATVGGTVFIRDAANDGSSIHSNWTWPGHMGVLVPSKIPSKFYSSVFADQQTLTTINSEMLAVPVNPASKPRLVISSDAVAISSVNIPKDTEFAVVDLRAIAEAQSKGATNITSVETTYGVIRAQWPDAPFLHVTAIPNRVGHFNDEARANYPQEFASTHNAGIALNHLLPHFIAAIA